MQQGCQFLASMNKIVSVKSFGLTPFDITANIICFEKYFESYSGHTLSFYPNLVKYRFKNIFLQDSLNQSSTVI